MDSYCSFAFYCRFDLLSSIWWITSRHQPFVELNTLLTDWHWHLFLRSLLPLAVTCQRDADNLQRNASLLHFTTDPLFILRIDHVALGISEGTVSTSLVGHQLNATKRSKVCDRWQKSPSGSFRNAPHAEDRGRSLKCILTIVDEIRLKFKGTLFRRH